MTMPRSTPARRRSVAIGALALLALVAPLAAGASARTGSSDPAITGPPRSAPERGRPTATRSTVPTTPARSRPTPPSRPVRTEPTPGPSVWPLGRPSPAGTASDLIGLQRRCTAAVDRRLGQLDRLAREVAAAPSLTGAHSGGLMSILSASRSGLTRLEAVIQADTDGASLRAHCLQIVTGFRIYALVTPQVHLVIAADRTSATAVRLDQAAARIADAIAKAAADGKETAKAAALLAQMQREIAAGKVAVAGVADRVLALTPATYNADPGVLGPGRRAVDEAQRHLRSASALGARAAAALRGAH